MHRCACPVRQKVHRPHRRTPDAMTWSPTATCVTLTPTSITSPAPSWPITHGTGVSNVPAIADRSEWQMPVAPTATRTMPGPVGTSSASSTTSSRSSPITRSTAARIASSPDLVLNGCGLRNPHEIGEPAVDGGAVDLLGRAGVAGTFVEAGEQLGVDVVGGIGYRDR